MILSEFYKIENAYFMGSYKVREALAMKSTVGQPLLTQDCEPNIYLPWSLCFKLYSSSIGWQNLGASLSFHLCQKCMISATAFQDVQISSVSRDMSISTRNMSWWCKWVIWNLSIEDLDRLNNDDCYVLWN